MTAEIINLRRARKSRARLEKAAGAAKNGAALGRTRQERLKEESDRTRLQKELDGKKLGGSPPDIEPR